MSETKHTQTDTPKKKELLLSIEQKLDKISESIELIPIPFQKTLLDMDLTPTQIGVFINRSRQTVVWQMNQGKIPHHKETNYKYRTSLKELIAHLQSQQEANNE